MSSTIQRPEVKAGPVREVTRRVPTATPSRSGPSGGFGWLIGAALIGITLLAAAVYGVPLITGSLSAERPKGFLTHDVARGELLVTVTEEGNVESANNVEIKCQVAGGSSILWIVKDGTTVKKGDKLVELDAAVLEDQINTQRIAFEKARSLKIQSEKNFNVAKIAVKEYLEGTFKKELQDAEAAITIALENLRSAQNSLQHSEKMFRKGYVSSLELEGQKFGVERAQLELDSARTAKEVLEKFTKVKMLEDLQSQRDNAEAQMKSDAAAYDLEETRLKRLESQIANCTIVAPQDGMAVYANEQQRGRFGGSETGIEEGAAVRERQTILRLPDLNQMQVKVNIHESKIDQMQPGMRARIRILDREATGVVTSVANQPEQTSWFTGNVKEYATTVRVEGESGGLRPGQTAEVEILVAHLQDVLTLPVAAVVEQRGAFFCWVETPQGPERRPLVLGMSNDQFIEVKDGVTEGDRLVLNPRAVVKEARQTVDRTADVDVGEKFGNGSEPRGVGLDTPGPLDPSGPADGAARGGDPRRSGDGDGGGRRGAEGRGRRGGGGGRGNLMQLDQDGDGKVSREEAPEPMRNFFDRMDSNSDGFIDKAEADALRQRFQEAGAGGGPPGAEGPEGGPPTQGRGPGRGF